MMKFEVILHEAEEGGYWVEVPSLPGCASQGESRAECLANIEEAVTAYIESLETDAEGLPEGWNG